MLQKFAMVKYGVFVAKICKHALCASTVRDIWWSPLARQLLPPCWSLVLCIKIKIRHSNDEKRGHLIISRPFRWRRLLTSRRFVFNLNAAQISFKAVGAPRLQSDLLNQVDQISPFEIINHIISNQKVIGSQKSLLIDRVWKVTKLRGKKLWGRDSVYMNKGYWSIVISIS